MEFWRKMFDSTYPTMVKRFLWVVVQYPNEDGVPQPLQTVVGILNKGIRVGAKVYWTDKTFPEVNYTAVKEEYCTFNLEGGSYIQCKAESEGLVVDYWVKDECVDTLSFLWEDFWVESNDEFGDEG
jgi:hypothetical protein